MIFGSVCSGIEAASAAWLPLGWSCAFHAEIDRPASSVLAHHYPGTRNLGDFTQIRTRWLRRLGVRSPDVLVGGTPCQDFSVAGLRAGLGGDRGNLTLEFLRLVRRLRPRWICWENVPGVFSSTHHDAPDPRPPDIDLDGDDGPADGEEVVVEDEYRSDEVHAFACFLAGLQELGYGCAYRVLDAQYAGVPQRRRRVFVVGYSGDRGGLAGSASREDIGRFSRVSAAVLFERASLSGNPPPGRAAGAGVARAPSGGPGDGRESAGYGGGINRERDTSTCLTRHGQQLDFDTETFVTHTLRADGFDASEDGTGRGTPLVPVAFNWQAGGTQTTLGYNPDDPTVGTIGCNQTPAIGYIVNAAESCATASHARESDVARCIDSTGSFATNQGGTVVMDGPATFDPVQITAGINRSRVDSSAPCHTLHHAAPAIIGMGVRRLTPVECERLQGFPDNWTLVPHRGRLMSDGSRYKMIGNSMAVPCMAWIGRRIEMVDGIIRGAS